MAVIFDRPKSLADVPTHYCPGCTHGIIHRLIAEVIDEMGIEGDTIGIAPVGCAVMAYDYFKCDMIEAAHQGDGDCAAIGTAETVHAATRGENIVVIFVNNAIYGMTGGQMAPTSLPGQVTQTTPYGRDVSVAGNPIKMVEMLSVLDGVALAQRVAVNTVPHIREAKKAIRKAFENEKEKRGFSIIEVLSSCPTNWGVSPEVALQKIDEVMIPFYPLGAYKDVTTEGAK